MGIYSIRNIINGKSYIGRSVNANLREYSHMGNLKRGKHTNVELQRDYNKYGKDSFEFSILETLDNMKHSRYIEYDYIMKCSSNGVYNKSDPRQEWNKNIDVELISFDELKLQVEQNYTQVEYEDLEHYCFHKFRSSIIKIREQLEYGNNNFVYFDDIIKEILIRTPLRNKDDKRVLVIIHKMILDSGLNIVYSSKLLKIFKKLGISVKPDVHIVINYKYVVDLYASVIKNFKRHEGVDINKRLNRILFDNKILLSDAIKSTTEKKGICFIDDLRDYLIHSCNISGRDINIFDSSVIQKEVGMSIYNNHISLTKYKKMHIIDSDVEIIKKSRIVLRSDMVN